MQHKKLKGGALYVSVIISILVSIILSLFILIAYFNLKSIQSQNSSNQLQLSLESGFEISQSKYYDNKNKWEKLVYNNDSILVYKKSWGCFTIINVKAKNTHYKIQKTGLFGCLAYRDTALLIAEQNRPIALAGKIQFNGLCFLPKSGIFTNCCSISSLEKLVWRRYTILKYVICGLSVIYKSSAPYANNCNTPPAII